MIVRPEDPSLHPKIRALLLNAFSGTAEADLVERLRADGDAAIALAAIEDDAVIGHIVMSRMSAPFRALGLGPLAVTTDWRRQGVGGELVRAALDQARGDGYDAVFVLGDSSYYARFGFSVTLAERFDSPYAGAHFMVLALGGGDLPASGGRVDYAPAFRALE